MHQTVISATALFKVQSDLADSTLHLPVEFYANRRCIMAQSVWKIFDRTIYMYKEYFRTNAADVGTLFICFLLVS
jgi:hypothetical protein